MEKYKTGRRRKVSHPGEPGHGSSSLDQVASEGEPEVGVSRRPALDDATFAKYIHIHVYVCVFSKKKKKN